MLLVISPAKTLDFVTSAATEKYTLPDLLDQSTELINLLRAMEPDKIGKLMSISPKLAALNSNRYREWTKPFNTGNAKQAVLAFKGDVYTGLDAATLSTTEMDFAQQHLRILSGLYGVLRPLDLIQAYRLEMSARLSSPSGNTLYDFWGNTITDVINKSLKKQQHQILINLASVEYFKSIRLEQLKGRVISPVFKDKKNGEYKIIGFFAKKARGLMSRYIIQNKLTNPEDIKGFTANGYIYKESRESDNNWLFIRDNLQ